MDDLVAVCGCSCQSARLALLTVFLNAVAMFNWPPDCCLKLYAHVCANDKTCFIHCDSVAMP